MPLDAKIEAILFWKGEPMSLKKLRDILGCEKKELQEALTVLEKSLKGRGLALIRREDEVLLGSAAEMGPVIEKLTREELVKDLGRAGLETLSIILYKGVVSRRDIDYIRGVNSAFIIRNLLIRGLIEKEQNKNDQRSFVYKPTFDLLSYLGLQKLEDLPEFATVKEEMILFEKAAEEIEKGNELVASS